MKYINPAFLAFLLICFLMPFVNIKCGNEKIATLSGLKLMTGGQIELSGTLGNFQKMGESDSKSKDKSVEPNFLVIITFALILIAAVLSFFLKTKKEVLIIVLAALAWLVHLVLKITFKVPDESNQGMAGMITLNFDIGYWIVFIGLLLTIAFNIYVLVTAAKNKVVIDVAPIAEPLQNNEVHPPQNTENIQQ